MEKLGNCNGGKSLFLCFLRVNYLTFCNSGPRMDLVQWCFSCISKQPIWEPCAPLSHTKIQNINEILKYTNTRMRLLHLKKKKSFDSSKQHLTLIPSIRAFFYFKVYQSIFCAFVLWNPYIGLLQAKLLLLLLPEYSSWQMSFRKK